MFGSRKCLAAAAGVLALGALGFATPAAHAAVIATGTPTPVTFGISPGTLTIAAPTATVAIGNLTSNGVSYTGSAALGSTTITDTRGIALASPLTVTATSGGFTGSNTSTVLPEADANLVPSVPAVTGGVALLPLSTPASNMGTSGEQILTGTSIGSGTATYTANLTITVPLASAIADTYSGTVTQTAS